MATLYCPTTFGIFEIEGSDLGIQRIRLSESAGENSPQIPDVLYEAMRQLDAYFKRKLENFDLPLDWEGHTDFNQAVWKLLMEIPYGHTSSYSAIADKLGDIKSVRAVGQANRNNPIAIVVPCHRVLAKNGQLHGYFYGLDFKRRLLELENPMSFGRQAALF